jgi:hypothetical protein
MVQVKIFIYFKFENLQIKFKKFIKNEQKKQNVTVELTTNIIFYH